MEDSKKILESSEQMKDVCKVNAQASIEAGHNEEAAIRVAKANIKTLHSEVIELKTVIGAKKAIVADLTARGEDSSEINWHQSSIKRWSKELDDKNAKIAQLKAHIKECEARLAEYAAEEIAEESAVTQDDTVENAVNTTAEEESAMENATIEIQTPNVEATISTEAVKHDMFRARYHVEITVDADSATDEEWAAACKAADHEATFATYDEAVNFIREGKAAAGKAFEGGHVSENIKNGGIIKQVHATSPTLEQMGAEVADILQKIDYAKSRGNNVGARELERKLSSTHQDYYYSIVHFGVEVSREQYEFAFKREIVKHNAKKEMERRHSDKYKAAVKAEAEYDAKQARAIIEANASVEGIEYVAEVKSLLDKAILSGNCSDIVYYAKELKRCLGKMTVPPVAEETTGTSDSIDTNVATEETSDEVLSSFAKYVEENRSVSYVKRYHGRNEADYYARYLAERNLVIEPTDDDQYEDAEPKVQIIRYGGEIKFYGYEDNIKDRVVNGTLGRKTTKRVNFRQSVELTRDEAAEIIASQGWTLERYLEMWLAKEAAKKEETHADWKRRGYTVEYVSKAWNDKRAAEYAEYLQKTAASDSIEEPATENAANENLAAATESDKNEEADTAIKDVELASSDASNFDDAVIKVETPEPTEPPIDSDAALTTLSSLALSALAALFNVIKVPDKSAPAEATAAEEVPVAQPVEKPAAAKSELDATREKISKTQDAIKKNTRRLMKLDAKVHGLGTELDFYEKAFKEALVDSAIESYSAPLDELTHIASQIGGKLIDKAKAETNADTLRVRIAKATARLEKLSAKLASLEVGIAAAA